MQYQSNNNIIYQHKSPRLNDNYYRNKNVLKLYITTKCALKPAFSATTRLEFKNNLNLIIARALPTLTGYHTEFNMQYMNTLTAAQAAVENSSVAPIAQTLSIAVPFSTGLQSRFSHETNQAAVAAEKVVKSIENTVVTIAALPLIEDTPLESSVAAEAVPTLQKSLEATKTEGTGRIIKSIEDRDKHINKRKMWLFCTGVLLVGAAAVGTVYCLNKKPSKPS